MIIRAGKFTHTTMPMWLVALWLPELANSRTLLYLWDWWPCGWHSWHIYARCCTCEIGGFMIVRAGKFTHTTIPMRLVALWLAELANSCTLLCLWDWWLNDWWSWQSQDHCYACWIRSFMMVRAILTYCWKYESHCSCFGLNSGHPVPCKPL